MQLVGLPEILPSFDYLRQNAKVATKKLTKNLAADLPTKKHLFNHDHLHFVI